MDMTALQGSSGDVGHFADRIFRQAKRPLWPRDNDEVPPEGMLDDRDAGGRMSVPGPGCVKTRES